MSFFRIQGFMLLFRFWAFIRLKKFEIMLTIRSLACYFSTEPLLIEEMILSPILWFSGKFKKFAGKIIVICIIFLKSVTVFSSYWVGIPYWWERNKLFTVIIFIIGNWILLNVIYHYYKALMTSPGYPPSISEIIQVTSICKRCIYPKPPRTHHCRICDKCILRMDHHCPLLNNCIGHFNYRHFYLYLCYVLAGVTFTLIVSYGIIHEILWPHKYEDSLWEEYNDMKTNSVRHTSAISKLTNNTYKLIGIQFTFFLCIATFLVSSILVTIYGVLISRGETCIEYIINHANRRKFGASYYNPYDYGNRKNWQLFLGLTDGRSFLRHVLLPSGHKPVTGNGYIWKNLNQGDLY